MSRPSQEDDDDFYDEEALLNIVPEEADEAEPEQDDPSEDGIDDDFLKELGKAKQTPFKRALKYFVFLLKGEANNKVRIINMPHPKTGTRDNGEIFSFFSSVLWCSLTALLKAPTPSLS